MSLAEYWRTRAQYRDTIVSEIHLVVEHPDYTFPGGVLACSIWPFVASEVTSYRVQRNYKTPTCRRCRDLIGWLLTFEVLDELKEKARAAGVLGK